MQGENWLKLQLEENKNEITKIKWRIKSAATTLKVVLIYKNQIVTTGNFCTNAFFFN